jgi:hypothetical protein
VTFFDWVILSLVTYRVTRLFQLDTLLEEQIDWLVLKRDDYKADAAAGDETAKHYLIRKALTGVTCAWCVSVWVAAGVLTFWTAITDYPWAWEWLMHWPAIAAGAMIVYRWTDPDATEVKMVDE